MSKTIYNWNDELNRAVVGFVRKMSVFAARKCTYLELESEAEALLTKLEQCPNFRMVDTCRVCKKWASCFISEDIGYCDNFKRERDYVDSTMQPQKRDMDCKACRRHGCDCDIGLLDECIGFEELS